MPLTLSSAMQDQQIRLLNMYVLCSFSAVVLIKNCDSLTLHATRVIKVKAETPVLLCTVNNIQVSFACQFPNIGSKYIRLCNPQNHNQMLNSYKQILLICITLNMHFSHLISILSNCCGYNGVTLYVSEARCFNYVTHSTITSLLVLLLYVTSAFPWKHNPMSFLQVQLGASFPFLQQKYEENNEE